jgi:hypothetical protein
LQLILSPEGNLDPLTNLYRPNLIRHKIVKLRIRRRFKRHTNNVPACDRAAISGQAQIPPTVIPAQSLP